MDALEILAPNNRMQRTVLCAAADAEGYPSKEEYRCPS